MTFNIHHGKGLDGKTDLSRILKEILKSEAEIIALQEVDRFQPRSYFRDQVAILAKGAGMFSCYSPSVNFGFSQYGNAILSKWPIESKTIFNMDGGLERRSMLFANIRISSAEGPNKLGSQFTIVNTHLGVHAKEYKWQMPILCNKLAELSKPTILMGDFNMEPSNAAMKISPDWHRIRLVQPQATMQNGKQIDHIFSNCGYKDARAWVQETDASDHHAVIADLPYFLR